MKKYVVIVLIFIMLFSLALPVRATSEKYELPELELSLSVPAEYDVFTRDMKKDDPLLAEYDISKDDLLEQFVSGDIYLNAVAPDGDEEIVVTMAENIISEFNGLGDTALMTLASALKDEYVNYGISVSSYDIYHHSQLVFIRIYFNTTDKSAYGLQYYTIYGNKAMNFTMRSYTGPISKSQENTIQSIVDSIYLDSYNHVTTSAEDTPAFNYTDVETGIKFTVPANWKREELSEDRDFIDAKFASTKDSGQVIMYGSTDLWSQMSASERIGYTRSDFDNTIFSASDIAEMLGASVPVKSVMYNSKEYYLAEVTTKTEAYGVNLSVTMTHIIRIENGWLYWFQFGGSSKSEYFGDVEKLINSVIYPETNTSNNFIPVIVLGGIVIVIVIVITLRKGKHRVDPMQNTAILQKNITPNIEKEFVFCHMCGEKLPKDSRFCHKCGTKTIEEG